MIQRIQSLFLFLAGGASVGLLWLPFASTPQPVASSMLFADGQYTLLDSPALLVMFLAAGALAMVGIFLFQNRKLQMRLTIFAIIANLIGIILGVLFFMQNSQEVTEEALQDEFGMYLPIISFVLLLLAYRFINKDEKLVRSMDRLR